MLYPYPGDDPDALNVLSISFDLSKSQVSQFGTQLGRIQGQLSDAWTGTVAVHAQDDLNTFVKIVPEMTKRFGDAKTAVDTYRGVIIKVRHEIDNLRSEHGKLSTAYNNDVDQYNSSDGYGQAHNYTDAQLQSYRSGITGDESRITSKLTALDQQYDAQVRAANRAAEDCASSLDSSHSTTAYQGSTLTTTGLPQLLGVDNLEGSHWQKMVDDAKQFENHAKDINNSNMDPQQRDAAIKALIAKYGLDAADADFATQVATDKGPQYFQQFLRDVGRYDNKHPVDPALEHDLLALQATILSTATNQKAPVHVDQSWIDDFFSDGHGGIQPEWVMAGSDYTRLGIRFPTAFLDAVGTSALKFEAQRGPNGLDANGRMYPPWSNFESDLFYPDGTPIGTDFYSNDDPLTSVMKQFTDHPDANSVLFSDHGGKDDELYALTHRAWGDGGAKALGDAVVAETGPNAGNIQASAQIATDYIHDVVQDPKSQPGYAGVPSELHDSVGTVIARYMGDLISPQGSGLPGADGSTQVSGLDEAGLIARAHFDSGDLGSALRFAMHDTNDKTARDALSGAWAKISAHDMSLAYQCVGDEYHGQVPGQQYDPSVVFDTAGQSAKVLGLITQSDVNGYNDAHAEAVEQAAMRREMLSKLEGLIPIPELPEGSPKIAGNVLDLGVDTVKDMVNDALVPDPADNTGANADEATRKALQQIDLLPRSIVTHLSQEGLPIVYDPATHQSVAGVDPQFPGASSFSTAVTNSDGTTSCVLKPYSQISKDPAALQAFNTWWHQHGYGPGDIPSSTYESTMEAKYTEGTEQADH